MARYSIVGPYCQVPTRSHLATALSHAKDSMDWPFVQWLLENGAEPTAFPDTNFPSEMIYGIGTSQGGVEDIFRGMVKEVEKDKGIRITMVKRESPGCWVASHCNEVSFSWVTKLLLLCTIRYSDTSLIAALKWKETKSRETWIPDEQGSDYYILKGRTMQDMRVETEVEISRPSCRCFSQTQRVRLVISEYLLRTVQLVSIYIK